VIPSNLTLKGGIFVGTAPSPAGDTVKDRATPEIAMLTDIEIRKAKPQDKPIKMTDGKTCW